MKDKETTHAENVAILTFYKMYGSSGAWPSQVSYSLREPMMQHLLRLRFLLTKRIGGEAMIFLSDLGLRVAKSLDSSSRVVSEHVHQR